MTNTPKQQGFRRPAEWERHNATWLAWPHNKTDWPGCLSQVQDFYFQLTAYISDCEQVWIIVRNTCDSDYILSKCNDYKINRKNIRFFNAETNRSWTRDFGPIF
ncbi:agmatine deiminase family protein, partial [Thermoproteota archaeon]